MPMFPGTASLATRIDQQERSDVVRQTCGADCSESKELRWESRHDLDKSTQNPLTSIWHQFAGWGNTEALSGLLDLK